MAFTTRRSRWLLIAELVALAGCGGGAAPEPPRYTLTVSSYITEPLLFGDFSGPIGFVAFQDGDGPWQQGPTYQDGSYKFPLHDHRYALYLGCATAKTSTLIAGTIEELDHLVVTCQRDSSGAGWKTMQVTSPAPPAGWTAAIAVGRNAVYVDAARSTTFWMQQTDRPDLLAMLVPSAPTSTDSPRFLTKRGLSPIQNPRVHPDWTEAEPGVLASIAFTKLDVDPTMPANIRTSADWVTSSGTTLRLDAPVKNPSSNWFPPQALQTPSDHFHILAEISRPDDLRVIERWTSAVDDLHLTLPNALLQPGVTQARAGDASLPEIEFASQEGTQLYLASFSSSSDSVTPTPGASWMMAATPGWFGSGPLRLAAPDLRPIGLISAGAMPASDAVIWQALGVVSNRDTAAAQDAMIAYDCSRCEAAREGLEIRAGVAIGFLPSLAPAMPPK